MLTESVRQLKIALKLLILMTLLTGLIYPLLVTGLAQALFPWKANGSLITVQGKIVGSHLLGQNFSDKKYFWGRPSATTPFPYNAQNSSGSNLGPSNPDLLSAVKARAALFQKADPGNHALIPLDLVTASASGLDPEISPLAAFYQAPRVAKSRGLTLDKINTLINNLIQPRCLGFLGEPRINVLELNLALDNLSGQKTNHG